MSECDHLWVITGAVQCSDHYADRHEYEFEWEWDAAQSPLCMKCHACQKCLAERETVEEAN